MYPENADMDIELFMEDSFEYLLFATFHVNCSKDPVFGLVFNTKTSFVAITFDEKVTPGNAHDFATLNAHAIGSVGNKRNLSSFPAGKFCNAPGQPVLFVYIHFRVISLSLCPRPASRGGCLLSNVRDGPRVRQGCFVYCFRLLFPNLTIAG